MKKKALFGSFVQYLRNSTRNSSRIPSSVDELAVCAFIRLYLIAEWGALLNQIRPRDYGEAEGNYGTDSSARSRTTYQGCGPSETFRVADRLATTSPLTRASHSSRDVFLDARLNPPTTT